MFPCRRVAGLQRQSARLDDAEPDRQRPTHLCLYLQCIYPCVYMLRHMPEFPPQCTFIEAGTCIRCKPPLELEPIDKFLHICHSEGQNQTHRKVIAWPFLDGNRWWLEHDPNSKRTWSQKRSSITISQLQWSVERMHVAPRNHASSKTSCYLLSLFHESTGSSNRRWWDLKGWVLHRNRPPRTNRIISIISNMKITINTTIN